MRKRCSSDKHYENIEVCAEWNCYASFRDWAFSTGFNESLTLDRIDNDRGYSPDNCRWATPKQQVANRSKTSRGGNRFKCVSFDKRAKRKQWLACVRSGGKKYQKYFFTEIEAAKYVDQLMIQLHGEFANLNFPMEVQNG